MRNLLIFSCALFLAAPCVADPDETADESDQRWRWSISLGVASWADIEALDPPAGGSFEQTGFVLEMAAHRPVASWGETAVHLGVDWGLFSAGGSVRGTRFSLTQRGMYLTPSAKFAFGEKQRVFAELGGGWYSVDFAELDCESAYICSELSVPYDADTFGGYLGAGARIGRHTTLSLRAHFADFGTPVGFTTTGQSLGGPIYILTVGFLF